MTKIDAIKKRSARLEKAAVQRRIEQKFKSVTDKNKYTERANNARQTVADNADRAIKESMRDYQQNQVDVVQRAAKRRNHERVQSANVYSKINKGSDYGEMDYQDSEGDAVVIEGTPEHKKAPNMTPGPGITQASLDMTNKPSSRPRTAQTRGKKQSAEEERI